MREGLKIIGKRITYKCITYSENFCEIDIKKIEIKHTFNKLTLFQSIRVESSTNESL